MGKLSNISPYKGDGTTPLLQKWLDILWKAISGDVEISGSLTVTDDASIGGDFAVSGVSRFGNGTYNANPTAGEEGHLFEIVNNVSDFQVFRMLTYGAPGDLQGQNNVHYYRARGTEASPSAVQDGDVFYSEGCRGHDGTANTSSASAHQAIAVGNWTNTSHGIKFVWETTPSGSTTRTRHMTLDGNGNLQVGDDTQNYHQLKKSVTTDAGNIVAGIANVFFYAVSGTGANAANAAIRMAKDNVTNRSINGAGTINASGADYAEYMVKSEGCGEIAKGDIVGINKDGQITDKWEESIHFMVKSTNPSFVGGDVWGTGEPPKDETGKKEFQARLEAKRKTVDRIAFAGQVPVNTPPGEPGDYIVPVQDGNGISGIPVKNPTFEQYRISVGRVIAGRDKPVIIVKAT